MLDLADRIAALHSHESLRFGFERPTPVGPLQRCNDWTNDWAVFFRDHRLMFLGRIAENAGRLPIGCFGRLEQLCARLTDWIPSDRPASLIHGDLWSGNIIYRDGRLVALIDSAIYYADAEIELAFMTVFGDIGTRFFDRYREHRAIDPMFFTERMALYQLEPILAHAWFFGGVYGARADSIIRRYVR